MRTVTSAEAKAELDGILAEVERAGRPVAIMSHGRAVAVISAATPRARVFGQFPGLAIPEDFDAPLPDEVAAWGGAS